MGSGSAAPGRHGVVRREDDRGSFVLRGFGRAGPWCDGVGWKFMCVRVLTIFAVVVVKKC